MRTFLHGDSDSSVVKMGSHLTVYDSVAKWEGGGLQPRERQFNSDHYLQGGAVTSKMKSGSVIYGNGEAPKHTGLTSALSLTCLGSSVVERQVEALRVGGPTPPWGTTKNRRAKYSKD